jgi:hypothetical protein
MMKGMAATANPSRHPLQSPRIAKKSSVVRVRRSVAADQSGYCPEEKSIGNTYLETVRANSRAAQANRIFSAELYLAFIEVLQAGSIVPKEQGK